MWLVKELDEEDCDEVDEELEEMLDKAFELLLLLEATVWPVAARYLYLLTQVWQQQFPKNIYYEI